MRKQVDEDDDNDAESDKEDADADDEDLYIVSWFIYSVMVYI